MTFKPESPPPLPTPPNPIPTQPPEYPLTLKLQCSRNLVTACVDVRLHVMKLDLHGLNYSMVELGFYIVEFGRNVNDDQCRRLDPMFVFLLLGVKCCVVVVTEF